MRDFSVHCGEGGGLDVEGAFFRVSGERAGEEVVAVRVAQVVGAPFEPLPDGVLRGDVRGVHGVGFRHGVREKASGVDCAGWMRA